VSYQWRNDIGGSVYNLGFLAQDIEKIIPEAVVAPKNDTETYGMKYTELIPVLVKAIQEQQKLIEELNRRINDLKKN
jgi:hypothetical protein